MPDSARSRRDLQNFLLFCTSSKALLSIRLLQLHSDSYLKISCFICLIIIMLTNIHSHFLSLHNPLCKWHLMMRRFAKQFLSLHVSKGLVVNQVVAPCCKFLLLDTQVSLLAPTHVSPSVHKFVRKSVRKSLHK